MIDRIHYVVVDGVHLVTVVPLLYWLAHAIMPQVSVRVHLRVNLVVWTSPISDLHLIMSIIRTSIEQNDIARIQRCPNISLSKVCMYQTWLYTSAFSFEGSDQSRNHSRKGGCSNLLKLWPWSVDPQIFAQDMLHQIREKLGPATLPVCSSLRRSSLTRPDMEPKFPRRGNTISM